MVYSADSCFCAWDQLWVGGWKMVLRLTCDVLSSTPELGTLRDVFCFVHWQSRSLPQNAAFQSSNWWSFTFTCVHQLYKIVWSLTLISIENEEARLGASRGQICTTVLTVIVCSLSLRHSLLTFQVFLSSMQLRIYSVAKCSKSKRTCEHVWFQKNVGYTLMLIKNGREGGREGTGVRDNHNEEEREVGSGTGKGLLRRALVGRPEFSIICSVCSVYEWKVCSVCRARGRPVKWLWWQFMISAVIVRIIHDDTTVIRPVIQ